MLVQCRGFVHPLKFDDTSLDGDCDVHLDGSLSGLDKELTLSSLNLVLATLLSLGCGNVNLLGLADLLRVLGLDHKLQCSP